MNTKRRALLFGALFLHATFVAPAAAATIVFEQPLQSEDLTAAHFDVNRQLGRAWVDVGLTPRIIAQAPESKEIPPGLDGLFYVPTTKPVIYPNVSSQPLSS